MSVSSDGNCDHCVARIDVGADSGAQPLVNDDGTVALAVNGEIYNHKVIRKHLKKPYDFKTHSDCEVIIPLVCQIRSLQLFWLVANNVVFGIWYRCT